MAHNWPMVENVATLGFRCQFLGVGVDSFGTQWFQRCVLA